MSTPPDDPGGSDWQRLDRRMLLIDPAKVLRQLLIPAIVAMVGIGSRQPAWTLPAIPVMILLAVLFGSIPWFTTRYRITDTQLIVKRGLLNKTRLTAPLDRIRSVDLEASLLHRALGLEKVQVGTGVDDTRIELDSLAAPQAEQLRSYLLHRSRVVPAQSPAQSSADVPLDQPADPDVLTVTQPADQPLGPTDELARLDWSWLRFAPFSLARLVIVVGALGALSQFVDDVPVLDADTGSAVWDWIVSHSPFLVIGLLVGGALATWLVISVLGYVVQWWDMRLFREHGTLRLTRGLFTTSSTTIEEARVRGVELSEPVLLRMVGGAELSTLSTGLESGVSAVLPPCPRDVALQVGSAVLETPEPLVVPLQEHGPAARRRCHVRAQRPVLFLTAATVAATFLLTLGWWIPVVVVLGLVAVGALAAESEYRHLGHQLTADHLVAGSGTLTRTRTALERAGIIGWVVSQTWFQRRRALATLIATTAAGTERVVIRDVPFGVAVALADAATPGMVSEFLRPARRPGSSARS